MYYEERDKKENTSVDGTEEKDINDKSFSEDENTDNVTAENEVVVEAVDNEDIVDTVEENKDNSEHKDETYRYSSNDIKDNTYYTEIPNTTTNGSGYTPKKKNMTAIIAVIAVVVILVGTLFVGTGYYILKSSDSTDDTSISNIIGNDKSDYDDIGSTDTTDSKQTQSNSGVTVTDVSGVVENAMPSVVAITSTTLMESNNYGDDFFEYYFGGGGNSKAYEAEAAGSGIIVDQTDTELLIVTNNHVVEGADKLSIQFYGQSGDDGVVGYLKGTDSNVDVAVVAVKLKDIDSNILKNIKKATLGDSDAIKVGEGVIAIGNALGYGQSVTTGIISAKDREVSIEEKTMKLLQTDAAINGGNSGGALLNSSGEVIGINVAKYSSDGTTSASIEGMGFAIPITSVKSIIGDLETKETRTKLDEDEQGYLGISGQDVTSDIAQMYGMPEGVYVSQLAKNGPAAEAGISQKDIITKFDGQQVKSMETLQNLLQYYKKGEKVKVTIAYISGKEYKEKEVTVKLGAKSVLSDIETGENK